MCPSQSSITLSSFRSLQDGNAASASQLSAISRLDSVFRGRRCLFRGRRAADKINGRRLDTPHHAVLILILIFIFITRGAEHPQILSHK
ncbi:hypothetical protein EYF80_059775 [Liparis tanakae]|uniref:Uncharacterized protein n=1 Tax=Liparis tanakae TaxID=230148 RepID=A0A4Z2EMS6_9TELE|nr:hypothetical protein EYF80_059775 [Liparis tanakae]